MASVSSSNTSLLPPWASESNNTSFRDVSFSSYLDSSEETYIHSLVESSQNLHFRKNKAEEGEIDVFSADKYFNGEDELNTTTRSGRKHHHHHHQYGKHHIKDVVIVNQPRTPSNHSESSSWHSQSALLRRGQRILPPRGSIGSRKVEGKRLFFPCCSCSDKNSVDVEVEVEGEPVMNHYQGKKDVNLETSDPFFFPPLSEITKKVHLGNEEEEDERRRKSLEVFGCGELDDHGIVERRLHMLSWDAIGVPTSVPPSESYKDTESDASSDLFEIEVGAGPTRCPSDVGPVTLTKTCYAPSEASIEWSVVTASAADFSTVSDAEDRRSGMTSVSRSKNMAPKKMNPSSNSKMSGILLGCKSQKAVRVAGEVHRTPSGREKFERERRQRYSDSFSAMTRFQAEAKVAGFGQKQVAVIVPPSPRWSHS